MKQAFLITGFNNWGKSTIISNLFGRCKFHYGNTYCLRDFREDIRFTVETHSNDDFWGRRWSDQIAEKLRYAPADDVNLFSALCPAVHENNNFAGLLSSAPFNRFDRIHVFLIEYKYDQMARLMTLEIISPGSGIPNTNFIVVNTGGVSDKEMERMSAGLDIIRAEILKFFAERK